MDDRSTHPPTGIVHKQSQLNRSTRGQWNLYASHREELERLLVPAQPGGRICVLGAGNCNDLDLRWLTQVYREVHLVDIDADALDRAAKSQKVETSERLRLHPSIDLTGLADRLGTWGKTSPPADEIQTCTRLAGQPPGQLAANLGAPFDVVLSSCVLSQLLTPLRDSIGEAHRAFPPLFAAMRSRHFRLMLDLLTPGGRGVFACDLFSSAVLADLARATKDQLPDLMRKMIASEKHFSGLDPVSIRSLLTRDPMLSSKVKNVQSTAPWLWHLGLSKTYLVHAFTFVKTATDPISSPSTMILR